MLGFLILYLKGTRIMMFQLSGFYYRDTGGLEAAGMSQLPVSNTASFSRRKDVG